MLITCSFAPPCNGPFNEPTATTIPEYISDKEETAQRAVNAEALSSWSACNTNALLNASTSVSVGNSLSTYIRS